MGRYNFNHLEELFDNSIPCIRPDNQIYCTKSNISNINLTAEEICGFIDPRVNITKNEFGIFTAGLTSWSRCRYLKESLKKYYYARKNSGGYYKLYRNYDIGVDTKPLKVQTAYNEINNTEILMIRLLNGDKKYKFTITYNEGEEYICVACKMDQSEFYDGTSYSDAAADTIFIAHILSAILLFLRPNECDLNAFKDNMVFNFNVFEKSSNEILKFLYNKYGEYHFILTNPSSTILGQENGLQLTYYYQKDSFMFIVTYTNEETKPVIDPNDVYTNIAEKINVGGEFNKNSDYYRLPALSAFTSIP